MIYNKVPCKDFFPEIHALSTTLEVPFEMGSGTRLQVNKSK